HVGAEWRLVGACGVELVCARDAGHGGVVWALAGRADLERALRGVRRSRRARRAGRHHVDERRILGPGRRLCAVRLAHHRPRLGRGREPSPGPKSCYACWMVNRGSTTERSKETRYVKTA